MVKAEFRVHESLVYCFPANIAQPLAWGINADYMKKHFYLAHFCDE